MKRILTGVLLSVILLAGCGRKPTVTTEGTFTTVITSDLHLSIDPNVNASVVRAMPYGSEVLQAIVNQVIAIHPDALILTGDNTNSGKPEDCQALHDYLKQVKDEGILVVMTTGNHDFGFSTPEEYEAQYFDLFEVKERDSASLSYTSETDEVVMIAMDDNSATMGETGTFSEETMRWLNQTLRDVSKEGKPILFLSHHNVTIGEPGESSRSYRITNTNLLGILKSYHVSLCLSGHLHGQQISTASGLPEIVSGMPLSTPHTLGILTIEDGELDYHTEAIDFAAYGRDGLAEAIKETDEAGAEAMRDVFLSLLEEEGIEQKDEVLELIEHFFQSYQEGSLGREAETIRTDSFYETMIQALYSHNYGPWMEHLMENPPEDATALHLELNN
ncbi:MAG: metallophosphoesterase [Solobacterium sp.]|nr:metallophosphoesterase [Solobacterium sp.]